MKVTFILVVIGSLGTVTKRLIQRLEDLEIRGWVDTIQITALLRSTRILRKVLETWGDLLLLKFQWKTISISWWGKLSRSNYNNKSSSSSRNSKGSKTEWDTLIPRAKVLDCGHEVNDFELMSYYYHIYPTPPLGQDMTQGQFLSGV